VYAGCLHTNCRCFMQMVVMPVLSSLWSARTMIIASFVMYFLKLVGLAVAQSKLQVFFSLAAGTLYFMAFPAIASIKANGVPAHEQGAVQGGLSGASALASGIGPLMFMQVYKLCTNAFFVPRVCSHTFQGAGNQQHRMVFCGCVAKRCLVCSPGHLLLSAHVVLPNISQPNAVRLNQSKQLSCDCAGGSCRAEHSAAGSRHWAGLESAAEMEAAESVRFQRLPGRTPARRALSRSNPCSRGPEQQGCCTHSELG
jgi:hypothetical protein